MVRVGLSEKVTFKQRLGERKAKPQGENLPISGILRRPVWLERKEQGKMVKDVVREISGQGQTLGWSTPELSVMEMFCSCVV